MAKFRTMRVDTPAIATHLIKNPDVYLTPVGSFLRKYSLDELPQLYSVLSVTMFEKVPILQVLREFSITEQPDDSCNQLQLFEL